MHKHITKGVSPTATGKMHPIKSKGNNVCSVNVFLITTKETVAHW